MEIRSASHTIKGPGYCVHSAVLNTGWRHHDLSTYRYLEITGGPFTGVKEEEEEKIQSHDNVREWSFVYRHVDILTHITGLNNKITPC